MENIIKYGCKPFYEAFKGRGTGEGGICLEMQPHSPKRAHMIDPPSFRGGMGKKYGRAGSRKRERERKKREREGERGKKGERDFFSPSLFPSSATSLPFLSSLPILSPFPPSLPLIPPLLTLTLQLLPPLTLPLSSP